MSLAPVWAAAESAGSWSFDVLRQQASQLAKSPYRPAAGASLPELLSKLTYDQYQCIRFRPESGPWRQEQLRFDLGFMHRGFIFADPVQVDLLNGGQARPFAFSSSLFNYDTLRVPSLPADLGFAGLKVVFTNETQRKWDEIASFLGASYFRLVGTRQHYGASARALAIDTGEAGGEEFPRLTHFWIEQPAKLADHLQLYGLLDSPSVAGACRFLLAPGEQTSAEIEVCLYPRNAAKKFGIAPLTSMFLVGENRTRFIPDFRPEVHDSDGLLIAGTDGTRLWRPLDNPEKKHRITQFPTAQLAGFGLLQRDRDFRSYEDLGAHYQMRPSLWVEFLNPPGEGTVELVEIPSPNEFNDNMVAYWVPKQRLEIGQEARFQYRLSALSIEPESKLLRVTATRLNPPQDKRPPRFVIDFSGGNLAASGTNSEVKARATTSRGQIKNLVTQFNDITGGWRVFFDLENAVGEAAELRLALEVGATPVSETWVYAYQSS